MRIDIAGRGADAERLRKHAAELVALAPDVILASGAPGVAPLLQATRTVPIVFAQIPDPVGAGFVDSLARPGGNATGFTPSNTAWQEMAELLKEIAPSVTRAAVLREPAITAGIGQFAVIQAVAPAVGGEFARSNMRDAAEIERTIKRSRAPPMEALS